MLGIKMMVAGALFWLMFGPAHFFTGAMTSFVCDGAIMVIQAYLREP